MELKSSTGPEAKPRTLIVSKDALRGIAKRGCQKCWGRGYKGTLDDGTLIPCRCVLPLLQSIKREVKA